jgi:diamine N-acetyltransferase
MSYFLRAPEPEDLDLLFRLENDPDVWTVSSCHMPYSRYALKQYILACKNDFFAEKQLRLMVQPSKGGEAEAIVDLFNFSPLDGRAELGLLVDSACRGRGVGQEALTLLCDYAAHTLGLRMIFCQIFADNAACRHLFEKMGFTEVAVLPEWVVAEGKKHDLVVVQRFF